LAKVPEDFPLKSQWAGLQAIGMAVRTTQRADGTTTGDVRYFISSAFTSGKRFAEAVRGHGAIENSLHWVLDVTFDEDRRSNAETAYGRQPLLATPLRDQSAEASSVRTQHQGKKPHGRLEQRIPDGSPYGARSLMCTGPDSGSRSACTVDYCDAIATKIAPEYRVTGKESRPVVYGQHSRSALSNEHTRHAQPLGTSP